MGKTGMGLLVLFGCSVVGAAGASTNARPLLELSLEELSDVVVTSASRRGEPLSRAAASVYVITAQDIHRSGATTLVDALRLAPNLLVADANAWDAAVTTSRGFFTPLGNKLLVMIDGRSVYTPLFSGVLWDAQDVMLEDVERIEVISGPAGAVWGTNAVNGVINVVTRSAADTSGTLASAYAGTRGDGIAARHGGKLPDGGWRVYAKHAQRNRLPLEAGGAGRDAGRRDQAGFRADWRQGGDAYTLQGDAYDGQREEPAGLRPLTGFNLLGRWTRNRGDGSSSRVQAYFDRSERDQARAFTETLDMVDVDAQHAFAARGRHAVTVGGGYRRANDRTGSPGAPVFVPPERTLRWVNLFVEDEITLRPDLRLTLGLRSENNSYTGWETMPNLKLAWQAAEGRLLWASLSRAVRSPSRFDRELAIATAAAPFSRPLGPGFVSETSSVAQLGYRAQVSPRFGFSVTGFLHRHDHLRSLETRPIGFTLENRIDATARGVEGWGTLQVSPAWRVMAGAVLLNTTFVGESGSSAPLTGEGNDPSWQWSVHSRHDLGSGLAFDLGLRRIGALPNPAVPAYTDLDARLGWAVSPGVEVAVAGQNLLDRRHPEFGAAATRAEIPRSVLLSVRVALH